jgi:mandelamide amidase
MNEFHSALAAASTVLELEEVVHAETGSPELMEFIRFDAGEVLRKERSGQQRRILRLVIGNPLIMMKMARTVPDAASHMEAARQADRSLRAGRSAPLLGVPLAVKDSYLTKGLTTTFGTSVLATFTPTRDAVAVAGVKDVGAIVFGKNNLVEMSYGLTGFNEHHGQAKNPYDKAHVTGGSSSGAGASVAARIVPAALSGDTVGSIRVPASLCGVVGYKPTPGRWPGDGVAPISGTWTRPVSLLATSKTANSWTPYSPRVLSKARTQPAT